MRESSIQITVKLFAAYQEVYGVPELQLSFPINTSVQEVLDFMVQEKPQLEQWRTITRFGVNLQFVEENTILHNGDEVVFIPPVSGG
ncbi:thiamine S protein [Stanieria cyanosphaera PCC 7437]|uniref:Molybdopterin synthase sulfur carrier subunit n=1 Tax=Stanieria cyanosphaera (strain ATCC 29371 / PCC 7437) TaxID=111780 RepID=K9XNF4_STAC7|nr:MoaD/ThiS family protein [Stanieria cyanosphaera]AFZ34140.1 thiamine S protein [Stanieria cyanosphaera PCC 7437]